MFKNQVVILRYSACLTHLVDEKNSNQIGKTLYDLMRFIDNSAVAYYFRPPCIPTL